MHKQENSVNFIWFSYGIITIITCVCIIYKARMHATPTIYVRRKQQATHRAQHIHVLNPKFSRNSILLGHQSEAEPLSSAVSGLARYQLSFAPLHNFSNMRGLKGLARFAVQPCLLSDDAPRVLSSMKHTGVYTWLYRLRCVSTCLNLLDIL